MTFTTNRAIVAAACLLAGSAALAQTPPPPPPGGPAATPPAAKAPEAGSVASGRVQQWLLNPNGDADGLLLADGTQVAFPPHLSAALMKMLQPGDTVQVSGWRAPHVPVLRAATLNANGQSVTNRPPTAGTPKPTPRDRAALSALNANGRIDRLLYTDRGDVRGVLLDDKTIVRFPPHVGAQNTALLQPGATLFVRGWGTRNAMGTAIEATGMGQTADGLRDVLGSAGPEGGPRGPGRPRGAGPAAGAVPPAPPMTSPPAPAAAS